MITLLKSRREAKRSAMQTRLSRDIYQELVGEIGSPPTTFEEDYPFQWPGSGAALPVLEIGSADTPLDVDFVVEEDRPATDQELIEFWERQSPRRKKKRHHL